MQQDNKIINIFKKQPVKTSLFFSCIILFAVVQVWNSYAPLLVSEWGLLFPAGIFLLLILYPGERNRITALGL